MGPSHLLLPSLYTVYSIPGMTSLAPTSEPSSCLPTPCLACGGMPLLHLVLSAFLGEQPEDRG